MFKDEAELLSVFDALHEEEVYPRRYFYPTLNELPYLERYDSWSLKRICTSKAFMFERELCNSQTYNYN